MGFVFTQTQMASKNFGRITSSNKTAISDRDKTATMSGGKSLVSLDFECASCIAITALDPIGSSRELAISRSAHHRAAFFLSRWNLGKSYRRILVTEGIRRQRFELAM
jgi:hypothetical protein